MAAFDIGTTTVAGYLLNAPDGTVLAVASRLNPQSQYGADVINRANYTLEHGMTEVTVCTKGYAKGQLNLKLRWDGPVIGSIPIAYANVWHLTTEKISIPDGVSSLYFEYQGMGHMQFAGFGFH